MATATAESEVTVRRGRRTDGAEAAREAEEAVEERAMTQEDSTADDLKAMLEAKLQAAYEEAMTSARLEIAEPLYWWDLYAIGPVQPGASLTPPAGFIGPLLPHQVIRVGEVAYVATILLLNPFFPPVGPSAAEILSKFALPYEVEYGTGELKRWQPGPANLQHVSGGQFTPGVPWATDVFWFRAQDPGLYEMNICARIFGCYKNIAPPFAGYATTIRDIDAQMFGPGPRWQYDQSIRFQVYR